MKLQNVTMRKVKAEPSRDKGDQLSHWLRRRRKHKRKWPEPKAELILDLHFHVYSYSAQVFHAEATLEIPTETGFEYFSISMSNKTRAGALRSVIEKIENSFWFHHMRSQGVRFRITGAVERIYRGYL